MVAIERREMNRFEDFEIIARSSARDPVLSVAVPVYNMERNGYLARLLESLTSQGEGLCELVFCDDCSQDGSLDLLRDYARNNKRVTVLKMNKNSKQGTARIGRFSCLKEAT